MKRGILGNVYMIISVAIMVGLFLASLRMFNGDIGALLRWLIEKFMDLCFWFADFFGMSEVFRSMFS